MGQHEPISINDAEACAAMRARIARQRRPSSQLPLRESLELVVEAWGELLITGAVCGVAGYILGAML